MERSVDNLKPATDTSKYNLRCNRNVSEKMTKKDFIYDIPAPFHGMRNEMRKEKSFHSPVKKPRGNFECVQTPSSGISAREIASRGGIGKGVGEGNLDKNPYGILKLIRPQNLLPDVTTGTPGTSHRSSNPQSGKEIIINEREDDSTETEIRRQIVLPIQIRRKIGSDSKTTRYTLPERKILRYQCNYCLERVATLLSLSTHVKYHCAKYCTTCFWILEPEESMIQHIQKAHPADGQGLRLPSPNRK